jgi:hypothetical protein
MPCARCPHHVVEITAADFTVGRLIGDALVKLGHTIERETVRLTMKEFQEIVLTKATDSADVPAEPAKKANDAPSGEPKTEVETKTTVRTTTTVTDPSGAQTTSSSTSTESNGQKDEK